VKPQLIEDFVADGKVFFEYRDYAFLGPESVTAATAAYCAAEQDQFWNFHNSIFENQGQAHNQGAYADARLRLIAEQSGLDLEAYDACYSSPEAKQAIEEMTAEAQAAGVSSTPSVFVNGEKIEWEGYDTLKPAIEKALARAGA
jgi:protein-disulfide isomerase